jgi:CelD/BcsL family acetyltransferase involved in cellulose biosynthesis
VDGPLIEPAAGALAVEEVCDRAAIAALGDEWERLRAAVGARGPFFTASWSAIYAASLAGVGSGRALRVLLVHRGGRLVAVLPLCAERRRLAGAPARVLRSLSDDHSQRFDLLLDPAHADPAANALVEHLRRDRSWDALELREVLDRGRTDGADFALAGADRLVAAATSAGLPAASWDAMSSPWMVLPADAAALDHQLGAKFRGNLRRRAKRLQAAHGRIALVRVPTDKSVHRDEIDGALEDGWALEAAGWKGQAGTAIACDPSLRARYRALAHAFAARGELALYFLTVGGRRVAFHFGLIDGGVYYLFKPGFDPALAGFGLGHLLLDRVARDLIERHVRELDFLGDDMPWKREWTDRLRRHSWRYLFAPTAYGRALHAWKFRLAPAVKRILPAR